MMGRRKERAQSSVASFDPEVALSLVQSFHKELEIGALIERIFTQASALSPACHLAYRHEAANVDLQYGEPGLHSVSYNLQFGADGDKGGEVRLTSRHRFSSEDLQTLEDLLTLAAPALTNALTVQALRTGSHSGAQKRAGAGQEDALVLIRLDGLGDVRTHHGEDVANTLIEKLRSQLNSGLREADGVFQIDDDHLAVLLPRTTRQGAERVAAKVEVLVTTIHYAEPEVQSLLTVSIGISTTNGAASAEAVLADARSALSEAVEHGARNILIH